MFYRTSLFALALVHTAPAVAQDARAPGETPSLTWVLEGARDFDARADYVPAAELYEIYAEACLETATAEIERGNPCRDTETALARAFELRRALGAFEHADRDAALFTTHFLYAEPRRALQIAHDLVRMQIAAGRFDQAAAALDGLDGQASSPRSALVADALRAAIADGRGDTRTARTHRRAVERRWSEEREALEADGPVALEVVHAAVAEGRLRRAEELVARYLETRAPRLRGVRDDRRWWSRVSPWLTRSRRRLVRARQALERVYELGSAGHSVIAAARIGEIYRHQLEMHSSLALPRNEYLVGLITLGIDRPGYDDARAHFETCIAWASHHAVAREWAERCERGLHSLDPAIYPQQAELHGRATYHATSVATPDRIDD